MILQRLSRRQNPLRIAEQCVISIPQSCRIYQRRQTHHVPLLKNDEQLRRDGVPGLLSPAGFDIAWTQYQRLMVQKLNDYTAGTPQANNQPQDLVIQNARDPNFAALFNHASMAWNNHFFFKCLSTDPNPVPMPIRFKQDLERDFTSVDTLRAEFLATARSMFGPGFVWLVQRRDRATANALRILTTYIAGSPLSKAHWRQQPIDMNTQNMQSAGGLSGADWRRHNEPTNAVGSFGHHSSNASNGVKQLAPGGVDIVPLLCVNTWEHVWLRDWGIQGKPKFLDAWWERIDWQVVNSAYTPNIPNTPNSFTW